MKRVLHILAGLGAGMLLLVLLSCTKGGLPSAAEQQEMNQEPKQEESRMSGKIQITISGTTLPVIIENNAATKALVAALRESPLTFTASDYGGFEKVGSLGRSLPTSNAQLTTEPGDVILYNGSSVVLFYGSNSWSYTRLGKIQYPTLDELKSFLKAGGGDISVTLSL